MLFYLILLFTAVPAIELVILIKAGQHIGAINTVMIIVFTGVLGAYLARMQGFFILAKIQENLNTGVVPTDEMIEGGLILCGGIVLLTPGFITDFFGFLLLIPFTRKLIKFWLKERLRRMIANGKTSTGSKSHDDNIIDV